MTSESSDAKGAYFLKFLLGLGLLFALTLAGFSYWGSLEAERTRQVHVCRSATTGTDVETLVDRLKSNAFEVEAEGKGTIRALISTPSSLPPLVCCFRHASGQITHRFAYELKRYFPGQDRCPFVDGTTRDQSDDSAP